MTEVMATNGNGFMDFLKPYKLDPTYENLLGNNRVERAKEILKTHKSIKKVSKNTYAVKSQSGISTYVVTNENGKYKCNCPDCITHGDGWQCKHILAVKEYLDEKITTVTKPKSNRDWTGYTLGQVNEEELVKCFLRQLCDTIETPTKTTGRPSIPYSDLLFCSVMKIYSKKSSRRAHTLLRDSAEKNLIEYAPNYNAVNKFLGQENITPLLHRLVRLSALPMSELETSFSIDSSGFQTTNFGEWCDSKHGKKFTDKKGNVIKARREHQWLKCHISSGNNTNVIADVIITESSGEGTGDVSNFGVLLDNTTGFFDVREVMADPAYISRDNYAKANELGVIPYILFKKNMLVSPKGCALWTQMFSEFMTHNAEYMKHYRLRNNVESTFSAVKAKMGETILSKTLTAQKNELLCKILAYNLTVLAEAFFINDLEVTF